MISLNNVDSAGHALHYFSKDDYYTEHEGLEHSEWFGKGAQTLGLSGKVEKDDFFKLLKGEVANQVLGKWVINEETKQREKEHRPGIDVTFSAPKSVSILTELTQDPRLRAAHETAVKKALTYLEKEFATTRITVNGQTQEVKTGNFAIALFRHNTSRELDMQTHTHAVIINATKCADGQWRSIHNDEIYKAQRLVGAIYTSEIADQYQKLGYEIVRTDDKGNFEIKGISREHIEHFSQRREQIKSALDTKGIDIQQASAQEKEDATLKTRARKIEVDHAQLLEQWKTRAQNISLNIDPIQKNAEIIHQQGVVHRADQLTGREAIEFGTAHLIDREAVVTKDDLLKTAIEHSVGRCRPQEVIKAFSTMEKEGFLVHIGDNDYTTAKMLSNERWMIKQIQGEKDKGVVPITPEKLEKGLKKAQESQGFSFTEGQKQAITTALTSPDRFVAIQGLAGTGKTTMLKTMRQLAQEEGCTVRGMAPSGTASKQLFRETGIATDTVSMFQIKERQLQKDIAFAKQYAPEFERKPEIWVVDESSFLNQRQKSRLDFMAKQANAKIVYLGDKSQLQGVEAGKPFELAQGKGIQTAYMTEISRQKTPDLKSAVDIIVGKDGQVTTEDTTALSKLTLAHNARAFKHMDKHGMVIEIKHEKSSDDADHKKSNLLLDTVVKDVLSMNQKEREQTVVITAYNKDRHIINQATRQGLQANGELSKEEQTKEIFVSKGWTPAKIKEAQYYSPGDVVRFNRDYQKIEAKKGDVMRVERVEASQGIVVLKKDFGGETIAWEPKKYSKAEVYLATNREIAQGELIRLTRNDEQFKNGEIARVVAIQGDQGVLEVKQGEQTTQHSVDFSKHKHWDHAYACTVHGAQGVTQHRAIFHIDIPEKETEKEQKQALANMAKVFGDRSFYVGVTRASHELKIYTNDKELAAKAITEKQDKTSAIESIEKVSVKEQQRHFEMSL